MDKEVLLLLLLLLLFLCKELSILVNDNLKFTSVYAEYEDQVEEMSIHISRNCFLTKKKYCVYFEKMPLMKFGLVYLHVY